MNPCRQFASRPAALCLAAFLAALPVRAAADGWHNASLASASIDEWMQDIKAVVPNLDQRLGTAALKAGRGAEDLKRLANRGNPGAKAGQGPAPGGRLNANFTPQEQQLLGRKANDCMEILAYMDPKNIFPHEFPRFPLDKIPQYRKAAKDLLRAMGPTGGTAVAGQLRADLMGAKRNLYDVTLTDSYYKDLLESLEVAAAEGNLKPEDLNALMEACSGQKPPEYADLAEKVRTIVFENLSLEAGIKWAAATQDRKSKQVIFERTRKRIATASTKELLDALKTPDLDSSFRRNIENQLATHIAKAGVAELLALQEAQRGQRIAQTAAEELAKRSPTYAEVARDVPRIWEFARSGDASVAAEARRQTINAFQRAPMSHCLHYLGQEDQQLKSLIWEQVDGRIQRADATVRAEYAQAALQAFQSEDAPLARRAAALELLAKFKDRRAARPIIEALPTMPRELWPKAGQELRNLTGQDFGPKAGDGVAEVSAAVKNWREWWKANGGR